MRWGGCVALNVRWLEERGHRPGLMYGTLALRLSSASLSSSCFPSPSYPPSSSCSMPSSSVSSSPASSAFSPSTSSFSCSNWGASHQPGFGILALKAFTFLLRCQFLDLAVMTLWMRREFLTTITWVR
ncbi:hypothetical protein BU26DRAFT_280703 [Trematosphaeria pertusa]|uniref:Uncharacterized protein n=1 Tax=Trematosphaeria pertusa TaxID=390896 RepID=A0A6A6ILK6_9PLEO|nr:uncharacterized protein BU26DRAFT_280703 [Trematosphaeria pertusa]KAF2251311.1 hypothetical protein BU26DRAFT_280703 [Trematosphaeria pertusa]